MRCNSPRVEIHPAYSATLEIIFSSAEYRSPNPRPVVLTLPLSLSEAMQRVHWRFRVIGGHRHAATTRSLDVISVIDVC